MSDEPIVVEVCKRDYKALWDALTTDMRFMSVHPAIKDRANLLLPGLGIILVYRPE